MDGARYRGPTYYGRPPVKAAPFNPALVGGYIFLAGLSGAAALLAALADLGGGRDAAGMVRRGRYLALLAPLLGAPLLIWDLHTPKRFYNMLRIAKGTSPMSIGTWLLACFSGFAGLAAAAQFGADRLGRHRSWLRGIGRGAQVPAALAGAGLATYTASLLAATSTPLWAAAPRALAVRFAGSAVASAAAALALGERSARRRRDLDAIALAALAAELAASSVARRHCREQGVEPAPGSPWGRVETIGAEGLGAWLPVGLLLVGAWRAGAAPGLARLAILAGSAALRVGVIGAGAASAEDPDSTFAITRPRDSVLRER